MPISQHLPTIVFNPTMPNCLFRQKQCMKDESSNPVPVPVPIPGQVSPNNFSIIYFNARSILPKMDELWFQLRILL